MRGIQWELMRPQDIEVRPAMTKDGKTTLLLYQDSRNTMDALDRNFGAFGWQIKYKDVAGQIYGCLSIKDPETGEWITKEDTGDESNISAQKGLSSDILKRVAVRFGYARELYSAPRIVVPDDGYGNSGNKVSKIEYNENREIVSLTIVNRFNKPIFEWSEGNVQSAPQSAATEPKTSQKRGRWTIEECVAEVRKVGNSHYRDEGVNMDKLKKWVDKKIAYYTEKNGWGCDPKIEEQYQKDFVNWIMDSDYKISLYS